jgi:hypothetical protein
MFLIFLHLLTRAIYEEATLLLSDLLSYFELSHVMNLLPDQSYLISH